VFGLEMGPQQIAHRLVNSTTKHQPSICLVD
jgi:hypothetical protein